MTDYRFTDYFEEQVLRKRPYLKKAWCIFVLKNAIRSEPQGRNRYRFWAAIPELDGRYLRVVTLADKLTIHNAFPDRVQTMRLNYHPDTDSLYIDLSERPSVESREVSEGIVLDYDVEGHLVGIDIDNASHKVELKKLVLSRLPGEIETEAA